MRYFSFGWIWHSICSWKYRKYPLSNQTMVSQQENYPPKWLAPSVNRGIIQKELSSFVVPAGIAFHLDVAMTAAFPEIIKIREVEERREIICVHSTFNDHRLISKNKLPDLTMASWFGKLKPTIFEPGHHLFGYNAWASSSFKLLVLIRQVPSKQNKGFAGHVWNIAFMQPYVQIVLNKLCGQGGRFGENRKVHITLPICCEQDWVPIHVENQRNQLYKRNPTQAYKPCGMIKLGIYFFFTGFATHQQPVWQGHKAVACIYTDISAICLR